MKRDRSRKRQQSLQRSARSKRNHQALREMQAKRNRRELKARRWPHIGMMSILAASRAAREVLQWAKATEADQNQEAQSAAPRSEIPGRSRKGLMAISMNKSKQGLTNSLYSALATILRYFKEWLLIYYILQLPIQIYITEILSMFWIRNYSSRN